MSLLRGGGQVNMLHFLDSWLDKLSIAAPVPYLVAAPASLLFLQILLTIIYYLLLITDKLSKDFPCVSVEEGTA